MRGSIDTVVFKYIVKDLCLSEDDQMKLRYSLSVLIGDSSKLVLIYLFFLAFNYQIDYLMSLLVLSIIRLFTGGLHFKTYAGCLLFSLGFFSASISLTHVVILPDIGLMSVGLLSLLAIAVFSPVTSKNRPNYSREKRLQFRLIGCAAVIFHLIGFMAIKNNPYFTIAIWVIFLQAIQLMIAKGVEHREKEISV